MSSKGRFFNKKPNPKYPMANSEFSGISPMSVPDMARCCCRSYKARKIFRIFRVYSGWC